MVSNQIPMNEINSAQPIATSRRRGRNDGNQVDFQTCAIVGEDDFACSDTDFVAMLMALGFDSKSDKPYEFRGRCYWVFPGPSQRFRLIASDFYGRHRPEETGISYSTFSRAFNIRGALGKMAKAALFSAGPTMDIRRL